MITERTRDRAGDGNDGISKLPSSLPFVSICYVYNIYTCTLQIQNRSFSRVCSNTRGLHTKPEVFQNLIFLKSDCCFEFHAGSSPHADAFFFLAKLTVFACQTQLAMSWLAQPRLLPHPLSKRLCVFCRCPFTNHVQTVENPVKSQPSKPVQKVRVSTGLVRVQYGFEKPEVFAKT